eukprot:15756831-Heterocapsa_arctica.AAC.1
MWLGSVARLSSWCAGPWPGYSRLRTQIHGAVWSTLRAGFCIRQSCCPPLTRLRLRSSLGGGASAWTAQVSGVPAHSVHQACPG